MFHRFAREFTRLEPIFSACVRHIFISLLTSQKSIGKRSHAAPLLPQRKASKHRSHSKDLVFRFFATASKAIGVFGLGLAVLASPSRCKRSDGVSQSEA
jgi:hypothetical protein